MPSGHATSAFAAAACLYCADRRYAWALFTLAAIIALSRVFVGVHYPADILVGAALGAGVGTLGAVSARRLFIRQTPL